MIYLINGIPGSGKTTTARALARRLTRAAHLEGDAIQDLIVSGRVSPGQEPADEENRQIELCVSHQCLLARSFHDAGFDVCIDYVVTGRARLEQYRSRLGPSLLLVTLDPGKDAALARDAGREKHVAERWAHLQSGMRRELSEEGLWIDNGTLSVEQVVDRIVAAGPPLRPR